MPDVLVTSRSFEENVAFFASTRRRCRPGSWTAARARPGSSWALATCCGCVDRYDRA